MRHGRWARSIGLGFLAVACAFFISRGVASLRRYERSSGQSTRWSGHEAASAPGPVVLGPDGVSSVRDRPIRIDPVHKGLLAIPEGELEACSLNICPHEKPETISSYLHILHLHGLDARFNHTKLNSSQAILKLFTDEDAGRSVLGTPIVVRTRTGVAFLGGGEDEGVRWLSTEAHRDQCLAVLVELGVPLSQRLQVAGGDAVLRDALRDSVANFSFGQRELQWTAVAYALCLPPQRAWTNKLGTTSSFDELAEALLDSRLPESSCSGLHLVWAMTMIHRVDREHYEILSSPVRRRLTDRLRELAAAAVDTQEPDGSWPPDWYRGLAGATQGTAPTPNLRAPEIRLLVTGHIAEWLVHLPQEFAMPEVCLKRAGLWLLSTLKEVNGHEGIQWVCPRTHGICAVRVLSRRG